MVLKEGLQKALSSVKVSERPHVAQRMSWACGRTTSREEDGILGHGFGLLGLATRADAGTRRFGL